MSKELNLKKNDIVQIVIDDVNINGDGIGKYNGIAIFVPKSAIGDFVRVKIIKEAKKYLVGRVEKYIKHSSDRAKCDCPYYSRCGGCAFRHISYQAELKIKEKHVSDCLSRLGGFKDLKVERILASEKIVGYRNKAQIPIGKDIEGSIISGFFSPRSHRINDCDNCKLHPEIFDEITSHIKIWMTKNNVLPYEETSHTGTIRHIYIRSNADCSEIMVCLVLNDEKNFNSKNLVNTLTNHFENISSIIINYNPEKTNVILGKKFKTIYGKNYITDTLCNLKFNISPESFYQINHDQTEKLYSLAIEHAELNKSQYLIDFYCGIGTIGMTMAHKVNHVTGTEIVSSAIQNAKENAKLNNIKNIDFICADSTEAIKNISNKNSNPNVVVVDPPRKGCSEKFIENLVKISPDTIVYISCNPATLAKDLKKLFELTQNYQFKKICPVDMFPRTKHVETVVVLKNSPN
ncbi:MAG: 23S rRNA (uracil(1939)-C(5))-methyltransferase RlmD [Acutalibacteraceae bacterium]